MGKQKEYFELKIESLRLLGKWAADCAERALPIYEEYCEGDARPRDAIADIRVFSDNGKRNAKLRVLAMDASQAAATAFTHPLRDVQQTKHLLGPATYCWRCPGEPEGKADWIS